MPVTEPEGTYLQKPDVQYMEGGVVVREEELLAVRDGALLVTGNYLASVALGVC